MCDVMMEILRQWMEFAEREVEEEKVAACCGYRRIGGCDAFSWRCEPTPSPDTPETRQERQYRHSNIFIFVVQLLDLESIFVCLAGYTCTASNRLMA